MRRDLFTWFLSGALLLLVPGIARAQGAPGGSPLSGIVVDMSMVVLDLSQMSTGEPTQKKQETIVNRLDELIAELEKECEACRGGTSGANPSRPLADSAIIGGPGGIGDLHAPRDGGKQWGKLPPHERDRITQSLTEGFPSRYGRLLERYYRRLAEEKPVDSDAEGADDAGDSAAPGAEK